MPTAQAIDHLTVTFSLTLIEKQNETGGNYDVNEDSYLFTSCGPSVDDEDASHSCHCLICCQTTMRQCDEFSAVVDSRTKALSVRPSLIVF